ncbi:M56 family metallopeptidase [Micromonospora sp. NPDC049301]|uniref:M56 family metallopeptidase n=1 Tax=Micromonospora sp. NPDC049301 TaxID=3155723 RepID=UPI003425528C
MFDHFVWSVLVVPPLLVVAARLTADRLEPSIAAASLAWSAAVTGVASIVNLTVFALKAIAEIPAVGRAFGWSAEVVAKDTKHVLWVSWTSLLLVAIAAVAAIERRQRRHQWTLQLGRDLSTEGRVVMVTEPKALAFTVPGEPGRIVVTTGMRQLLNERQFAALLAHEHAHLTGGHHRFVRMAGLAAVSHPVLRWVSRYVDYLVERAADEKAADDVGSRRTVAQAIGAIALSTSSRPAPYGLNAVSSGGAMPRRVAHLLHPRRAIRWPALRALPVVFALASVVWTAEAIYDLMELLAEARRKR